MGQHILDYISVWESGNWSQLLFFFWHTRLSDGDNQGQEEASQFLDDDRNSVAISMNSAAKKQKESHLTHTEGCKDWDFLVGRRRYLLPGHYTTFMADLGANAEAAGKQREKAYV